MEIFIGNLAYSIIEIPINENYQKKVRRFGILSCVSKQFGNSRKIFFFVQKALQIVLIKFFNQTNIRKVSLLKLLKNSFFSQTIHDKKKSHTKLFTRKSSVNMHSHIF